MNAITKQQPGGEVADYGASLLEVIGRAARDPAVDIDKMERLIAMQERIQGREAELAFNQALNAAQSEMRPVAANASNPQTRSRYATYDKLDRVLRPIYTEHGFSLSFDEGESPKPEHVRVLCYVSHISGHTRTYHRDMPADGKGAKGGDVMTKTHAAGAAGSYGARYLLKGIFNVAVGEEDDDGNVVTRNVRGPEREEPVVEGYVFPEGPATGITQLKSMARALWREIEGCGDDSELDALLGVEDNKALMKQLAALENPAHRTIWEGDGGDNPGIAGLIIRKQAEFNAALGPNILQAG